MNIKDFFFSHTKVKLLAFFVSFLFWLVILGQRSVVVTREVPLDFIVDPRFNLETKTETVTVKLSAKRSALQSFVPESASPLVDVRGLPRGNNRISINVNSFSLPVGAKVLSVEPKVIELYLKYKKKNLKSIEEYEFKAQEKEGVSDEN